MKIEIKSIFSGEVLFSLEKENNSIKITLEAAIKAGANLEGADLRGADLRGADLRGAALGGADLGGADLGGAALGGADLGGADLRGAALGGADLGGANLKDANLWGARGNNKEIKSLHASRYDVTWTDDVVQIGCKRYSKHEWLMFSDEEISAMDDGALEWWTEWKDKLIAIGVFGDD